MDFVKSILNYLASPNYSSSVPSSVEVSNVAWRRRHCALPLGLEIEAQFKSPIKSFGFFSLPFYSVNNTENSRIQCLNIV